MREKKKNRLYSIRPLFDQAQHLIELGREQIESGQNPPIGPKIIPLFNRTTGMIPD